MTCMCFMAVALKYGGCCRRYVVVNVRKVTRNPDIITYSRVVIVGKNREAW